MKRINIAIDGPAGAGKSTVAKLVAEKLSYIYVDTGAMYRAVTWRAIEKNVDVDDESELVMLLSDIRIHIEPSTYGQKVLVNGEDVTEKIRTRQVTNLVSNVAGHALVRQKMTEIQKNLAKPKGVVMDGRDIGTQVLPDAEVKIYLSASIEERANRRYIEMKQKDEAVSLADLQKEIQQRDEQDMNRKNSPLKKAKDAVKINSTDLTIEQVVQSILSIVKDRLPKGE